MKMAINTARLMSLRVSSSSSRRCRTTVAEKVGFTTTATTNNINNDDCSRNYGKISDRKSLSSSTVSPAKAVSVANTDGGLALSAVPELDSLISQAKHLFVLLVKKVSKLVASLQKIQFQLLFEKAIIDCRFFTLIGVAGSLLGSVLCYVEGSFIILQSYMQYFHSLSHKADQGHVMHLLIEAIDMFLVGTAMLIFGIGLYSMFVGSKSLKEKGTWLAGSNLFGLFYMKGVPRWVLEIESISDAKSKFGHALMMLLQVGVLDKFKTVPLVTPSDLACFAATVLISSACIFVLSKLSLDKATS